MSNINYSMIVAVSDNNVIGKNGTMPWHLKTDLQRFKELTTNHCVIMGRKCYESIGKPLPNRTNTLYRQAINLVNFLYLTRVHTTIEDGDVFFPELDMNQWEVTSSTDFKADADNDFDTTFMILRRKR